MNEERLIIKGYQPINSNDEQPNPPTSGSDVYTMRADPERERRSNVINAINNANAEVKYIDISKGGKTSKYAEAKERVKAFRRVFPEGSISTKLIEWDKESGNITMKAEVFNENGSLLSSGYACENVNIGMVNKGGSALENCETSAVARALGFLGIGIGDGIASAEIMQRVTDQKEATNYMKICHCCGRPINDAVDKSGRTWHADEIAKITVSTYGDAYCLPCLMELKNKKSKLEG